MNISIVIPNYNGEELLRKNLPKVIEATNYYRQQSKGKIEIIVVDDGSTDGSLDLIKTMIKEYSCRFTIGTKESLGKEKVNMPFIRDNPRTLTIRLIENQVNLGFSSSVNKGVEESSGEIIVLLNTDVRPQEDFLLPLIEHFSDEKVFAVGCMDKSVENGKVVLRGRGIGQWKRGFLVHRRGEVNKTDTLWVSGGSGAFKKSIWDKLEGFNELYNPFYWEDIDLSYRAIKSGYKVLFEPKSTVVHEHEKGAINRKYPSFRIKIIAYRNQFIFAWENLTDLDSQFLHIIWLPYHLLKALLSKDWAFFVGFFQAIILLPKIIYSSFGGKKYFVKKDKEVIKKFIT